MLIDEYEPFLLWNNKKIHDKGFVSISIVSMISFYNWFITIPSFELWVAYDMPQPERGVWIFNRP